MEKVVLTDGESIEIVVAKGSIKIDSDGCVTADGGVIGSELDLSGVIDETQAQDRQNRQIAFDSLQRYNGAQLEEIRSPYEPSKLDIISHFINLLCDAQRSGYDSRKEISEALAAYKQEAGI